MDGINIDDLTIEQYLRLTQENQTPSMVKKVDDMTISEYIEYEERMKSQYSRNFESYFPTYSGHCTSSNKTTIEFPCNAYFNPILPNTEFNYDSEDMELDEKAGYTTDVESIMKLYTTFSTLAGKLGWRGRSWVFDLNKSDLCPSFIEGLTPKGLGPACGGFSYCAKDSIATQTCELSKEEFNDFLTLYPIPSKYRVILPNTNQTIFDTSPGFVGLYTHSFSLENLRLPLTEFFCEVLEYFHVHISRLNLFGCAKLTTFVVMCKAYGCEPYVYLLWGFFNLCQAGNWLTFAKRFEKHILNLLPKVITRIEDKLVPNIKENPMFQRLGRYSTSVRVFPDPILFLDGLKPSREYEVIADFGGSLKPELFVVYPGSVAAWIKDMKCKTRGGSSRPPVERKLAPGSSTSHATRAKTSSSKGDAPFLTVSDEDEDRLSFFNLPCIRSCELLHVIEKLRGEFDVMRSRERAREEECEGLRVKCKVAMIEFEKNLTVVALQEKISSLSIEVKEHKLNHDRMMLESQKWAGYQQSLSTFKSKVTSLKAEKVRLEAVEVSLRKEVEELKQDRREVVSKVIPYAVMELVYSDDIGSLVGKLVSSAILYGRCRAYKQVVDMKEPFDLSKVKGYSSSYKKDHTQASNDFTTATFPWHVPSRTQVPLPTSQRATPSSALVSNSVSPLADASGAKPQSSPLQ
ncbi:hypothetical protein Tco_0064764 [Tanacetum coccineum]